MSARKVPHTGPGHTSGDPAWCEGCAAEMSTTDDTTSLQEQVRWICHTGGINDEGELDGDLLAEQITSAVLPIIAAEVRNAQADAWDEAIGEVSADQPWDVESGYPNPYHSDQTEEHPHG